MDGLEKILQYTKKNKADLQSRPLGSMFRIATLN